MLKTIDFVGMRYTYDDTLFPNENTQVGELFVDFNTKNPLRLIQDIKKDIEGDDYFEAQLLVQERLSGTMYSYPMHCINTTTPSWFKVIKVEPIPEIPVLKVGMTIYHIGYGKGKVVEILPEKERIVCTFDSTPQYNSRYHFRYNGVDIENTEQVLSFQPITLPKFEFKLEPKRVYIKDKINTDNLSDAMKRCKLIEHTILLIESGKELFYDYDNFNPIRTSKINTSDVFTSVVDMSRVYYYE